jgi:hypothetical protein
MMPLDTEIAGAMKGDEPKRGKGKKARPVAEIVANLSPAQRSKLRARAEEILNAINALESENEEPTEEEELL